MKFGATHCLSLAVGLALAGCSVPAASGPVTITKVNPYHLYSIVPIRTQDPTIRFEKSRLLHGAVEFSEQRGRFGNYFTIFWKTERREPVVVRLEYRQGKTGLKTYVQEEVVDKPKRSNTTKFEIIGDDYQEQGKVTQWKASVIENGAVVAEYKSYLWQ